ncbi:FG-GAP-like repeat-containing protein [Alisedimentitalea sp. MJ-SS2]|uniref:FG-GAP-like repeat-containing protein n=1 Tax=Aliisedimentitalea sp. MJ-SS2 TaxID=3049795 RepID=UPI002909C985|nr:FG-GAP-like repeat-containing protein [Alisedimentitalea sp. MJ-SS2]MDU8925806.1 FG-GAP-like repeat-containing protein [Alisedimentitalea sp. MJ-SS2]
MNHSARTIDPPRLILSLLILVCLAAVFWTTSRYPALDEKAMMAGAIQLEDSLSFEAKFPVSPDMGVLERIFWSTLNWINTNKKGMTFGLLFAAGFLTAAAYVQRRSFSNGFANSFLGLIIGTPLGVCVNCAAPIAKGMYSAGMRAETTLSAMIASPTLNIVVLTMLFSVMPPYMAALKIVLSLVIILLLIPFICRTLPEREIIPVDVSPPAFFGLDGPAVGQAPKPGIIAALVSVITAYFKNLWFVIKLTVPLMLLAGFLGALAATLLPHDLILGLPYAAWILIPLALVGVFLPVPIAFDVVVTGGLLGLGLSHGYVMVLLFTLGSFSVYSFLIIYQSVGRRAAWMLTGSVVLLGILGGLIAQTYHDWQTERALRMLLEDARAPMTAPAPGWSLIPAAHAATTDPWQVSSEDAGNTTVTAAPFAAPSPAGDTPFTRMEATKIGIDKPVEFSMRDMWPPFWEGRSLSSGDIDRDGDLDIAIASTEVGLYLYLNDGTGQFTRQTVDLGPLAQAHIFNAALADLDNDGWLDLTVATYLQGSFFWRNHDGQFGPSAPVKLLNNPSTPLAMAMSFADADQNGYLDIAMGNWAAGWYRRIPGEESRNRILWTVDGTPSGKTTDMPGIPGETLSILFSDINNDGHTDLIVGNDFDIPDYFYLGDGTGNWEMITHASGQIPHTTTTTMALKTGDLSGNGHPEIYLAQIAGRSSGISETLKMQDIELYCDAIADAEAKAICEKNMGIKRWYKTGNNFDPTYASKCGQMSGRYKSECRALLVKDLAIQKRDPGVCKLIPKDQPIPRAYCDLHFLPPRPVPAEEADLTHQQILRSNVLLEWQSEGYADTAEKRGLEVGGWSWDTKLGDFDLDGDLDMYIVNGTWVPNEVTPSNLYFDNDGSGKFTEASGPMGLEDYLMTASATQFDADGDGDLDILTHPVNGPLAFFRNNAQSRAIGFALVDHTGNRDGIGAVITLTDSTGRSQRQELQLGGGFMSFDAPHVHFGLADLPEADSAHIRWPDGSETTIAGPLPTGQLYTITRQ